MSWDKQRSREFGERVRSLRIATGLSQEGLAHAAGISKNQMQLIEAGRGSASESGPPSNPRMTTVYGLAEALGVTVGALLP